MNSGPRQPSQRSSADQRQRTKNERFQERNHSARHQDTEDEDEGNGNGANGAALRALRVPPRVPRIGGYCSWDCYDADDDEEGDAEEEQAA